MADNPISTSSILPTPDDPAHVAFPGAAGPSQPTGGPSGETKAFSLPNGQEGSGVAAISDKPSLMDLAKEGQTPVSKEQLSALSEQLNQLNTKLGGVKNSLQDPQTAQTLTKDHYDAFYTLIDKMNPDLNNLAKGGKTSFSSPEHQPDEPMLGYIIRWIDGSQQTLGETANYLSTQQTLNPSDFLKVQYASQRAVQRGELFASIVGTSVSGIKTIMSTQLG